MSVRWLEVIRFPSVATAIAQRLGVEPPPECRIEKGRATLTFRRIGASRWPEGQQMEYAMRAAAAVRAVCADDDRRTVRRGARWATVVVFEDAVTVQGCAVVARWECVVPVRS